MLYPVRPNCAPNAAATSGRATFTAAWPRNTGAPARSSGYAYTGTISIPPPDPAAKIAAQPPTRNDGRTVALSPGASITPTADCCPVTFTVRASGNVPEIVLCANTTIV